MDNVDIQKSKLDWFRSQITIVKEEALFPDMSILENILYGNTSEISEVSDICKELQIHKVLVALPKVSQSILFYEEIKVISATRKI